MQEAFYPQRNGVWAGYLYSGNCPELLSIDKWETDVSFPQILIHLFNQCSLTNHYDPSTRPRRVNRFDLCPQGINHLVREKKGEKIKQITKSMYLQVEVSFTKEKNQGL